MLPWKYGFASDGWTDDPLSGKEQMSAAEIAADHSILLGEDPATWLYDLPIVLSRNARLLDTSVSCQQYIRRSKRSTLYENDLLQRSRDEVFHTVILGKHRIDGCCETNQSTRI